MSRICRPHSSPRRAPVTTTSHRYRPRAALRARASAITVATSSGEVAGMGRRMVVGGLADSAGLRSVYSQRWAAPNAPNAPNAPDRMLWIPRIVLAFIGWQTCGRHPARRQSWPGPGRFRASGDAASALPATIAVWPRGRRIRPSTASTSRARRTTPLPIPCRALCSVIDGISSPGARALT